MLIDSTLTSASSSHNLCMFDGFPHDSNSNSLTKGNGGVRGKSGHSTGHTELQSKSSTLPLSTGSAHICKHKVLHKNSNYTWTPQDKAKAEATGQASQVSCGGVCVGGEMACTTAHSVDQCSVNASMTIRRVLQLYELGEYREAAQIISRLPYGSFRAVVLDLPVDVFVEAMPVSLPILDALYAKVFFAGRDLLAFGFKFLHPENVVSHMIRMFAMGNLYATAGNEESIIICKKLLKVSALKAAAKCIG